jgi:hypothetical protein
VRKDKKVKSEMRVLGLEGEKRHGREPPVILRHSLKARLFDPKPVGERWMVNPNLPAYALDAT